jgi:hypothetical protein
VARHRRDRGVAAGAWFAMQPRGQRDDDAVVTAFPSQQFVVLNATGYVVAQRKAAISSKATGASSGSASPKARA